MSKKVQPDEGLSAVLWEHFNTDDHGMKALQQLYEDDPKAYLELCAKLSPKPKPVAPALDVKTKQSFVELLAGAHEAVKEYRQLQHIRERAINAEYKEEDRSSSAEAQASTEHAESQRDPPPEDSGKEDAGRWSAGAIEALKATSARKGRTKAQNRAGDSSDPFRASGEDDRQEPEDNEPRPTRIKPSSTARRRTSRAKSDSQQGTPSNRTDEEMDN